MKEIFVLNEDGQLQKISAGVESYEELLNAPIDITYKDRVLSPEELLALCESLETGRYDITTAESGAEWLIIDKSKATAEEPGRYRRITVDSDLIYDYASQGWIYISNQNAKALVASIPNFNDINGKIVVVGSKVVVQCYYYSTFGPGVVNVIKDNIVKYTAGVISGQTLEIDISEFIEDGGQSFTITVSNNSEAADYNVTIGLTGVALTYTPYFDIYKEYSGDVPFGFDYYGTGEKRVYFRIENSKGVAEYDNNEIYSTVSGNGTIYIPASYFAHGENHIYSYLYILNEKGEIVTNTTEQLYRIPWREVDNADPIIMTYYDYASIKEYDTISVPYYIWSNRNADSIKLELKYTQLINGIPVVQTPIVQNYTKEVESQLTNYLTYNTRHNWQLSNIPHGDLQFNIYLNGASEANYASEIITVAPSDLNLSPTSGAVFSFLPTDITSTEAISEWTESNGYTMKLNGLNWNSDGFVTDAEGNKSLYFSTNATGLIEDIHLFNKSTGFTFEIDYLVEDAVDELNPIIRYGHTNNSGTRFYGIDVYPIKSILNFNANASEGNDIEINFQKGERVHLAYVFENGQSASRYIKTYINGVMSNITKIPDIDVADPSKLMINLKLNKIRLYALRGYARALSSKEIVQNYASNFGNVAKKTAIILQNDVYSDKMLSCVYTPETGDPITYNISGENFVDYNKVVKSKSISTFVVIADALPDSKTYVPFKKIIFIDLGPNNDGTTKWITRGDLNTQPGNEMQGQGTSSLVYPRKNIKFKFKNKLQIKGNGEKSGGEEKNFTFKCDYMDSSGANNIGNAIVTQNSIRLDDWKGTPIGDTVKPDGSENVPARLNLNGFPVAMFWAKDYETDKDGNAIPVNPEYIGTYNFNYDKKIKSVGRYEDDNYPFQGFEFRNNTSTECLQTGIRNLTSFMSGDDGYEWRWSPLTDWIDDYHDKHLNDTMGGGFFLEDDGVVNSKSEAEYLYDRLTDGDIAIVPAYDAWYIDTPNGKRRLYYQNELNEKIYADYRLINGYNDDVFECEYGLKIENNAIYWQVPYGVTSDTPLGQMYSPGQGYYAFSCNPEHEAKFKLFKDHEYYTNTELYWNKLIDIDQLYYVDYEQDGMGTHLLDDDGNYYAIASYPTYDLDAEGKYQYKEDGSGSYIGIKEDEYKLISEIAEEDTYKPVWRTVSMLTEDTFIVEDLQKEIFKNWYYCVDMLVHCDASNYEALMDSTKTYNGVLGNNGNGLFLKSALLNYFVSSVTTAICDNFCKNMFMHTYDGGKTWVPAWYDMDTAYGLNNVGKYAYNYDIDFDNGIVDENGIITKAGSFNGSNSKLWSLFYKLYFNDIKDQYSKMRTADNISYNKIMNVLYGENIKYKFPALYNANAFYRYIIPDLQQMSDNHLEAGQGSRYELLKYWNKNREYYMESRYNGGSFISSKITLRMNCDNEAQFELKPAVNMYLGVSVDSQDASKPGVRSDSKILANNVWSYTTSRGSAFSDTNTYIFGANNLLDVGDMGNWILSTCDLSAANNLQRIKLGMATNSNAHKEYQVDTKIQTDGQTVTLSSQPYNNLRELDMENCNRLVNTVINLSNICPVLETVNLKGSNVSEIRFAEYSPLKTLSYPATINVIKLNNLTELETVTFEGYSKITAIDITNTPKFNSLQLLRDMYDNNFRDVNSIKCDSLNGSYEEAVDLAMLNWLKDDVQANLGGVIYAKALDEAELDVYNEYWSTRGGLRIELHQVFKDDAVLGVSGESSVRALTREFGAKTLETYYAFKDTFAVDNPYDNTFYSKLKIVTDEDGTWLQIPPFYTKYETDELGRVIGRYISEFKVDSSYIMNPEFIDVNGVTRDVYIACYLTGEENGVLVNKTNTTPVRKSYTSWQNAINEFILDKEDRQAYAYTTETIWTRQLLQDLFAIEFATTDSTGVFKGLDNLTTTGATDDLCYMTGINAIEAIGNSNTEFKYRSLENLWRNGAATVVQGLASRYGVLYVTHVPNIGWNEVDWIKLNNQISNGLNYLQQLRVEKVGDYQITLPFEITDKANDSMYKDYVNSDWTASGTRYATTGGSGEGRGLWSLFTSTSTSVDTYSRLVKRIKNNAKN